VNGWGRVRVHKQAVEGNDPHGGQGCMREGDKARVGVRRVSHGVVEIKLLYFKAFCGVFNLPRDGRLS
jgi:hypothetical protein